LSKEPQKQALGVILIIVGVLFLLVSNHLILGWEDVWPLFPLLGGIFFLKLSSTRRDSEIVFIGMAMLLLGVFFLCFTFGMLDWENMQTLWPTFPLIGGASFIAVAVTRKNSASPFVVGIAALLIAFVGYLYTGGVISERVAQPFVRLWPLLLIAIGAVVFLRARAKEEYDAKQEVAAPLQVEEPPKSEGPDVNT
jgi:glucose uptake protein GlcU